MPKTTLNRFPLFGLFAYRAARHMGYPDDDARLLGYSTAVLYAIFKALPRVSLLDHQAVYRKWRGSAVLCSYA